jgi:RNA polymerase sigma-70 factor, ECF subfamily
VGAIVGALYAGASENLEHNSKPMPITPPATRASLILRLPDAGDMIAWETFVQLYSPALFRIACRHGLQAADAENLVQEVLLSVSRSISRWLMREDRGSFRAWLSTIAKHEAIDLMTRRGTRPLATEMASLDSQDGATWASRDELASKMELEYRREVFQWAATQVRDQVSETTWRAFAQTHLEGQSIDAVAQQLGVRPGVVYLSRSRVMHRIKTWVAQWEEAGS